MFKLRLYRNDILLPSTLNVLIPNADGSYKKHNEPVQRCYYHGYLEGRKASAASLSTCDGLGKLFKFHTFIFCTRNNLSFGASKFFEN